MKRAFAASLLLAACGGGGTSDAGPPDAGAPPREVEAPSVIEPVWIAGGPIGWPGF